MDSWQSFEIPSSVDAIRLVRERVDGMLQAASWSRQSSLEVMLILDELISNAIRHGNASREDRRVRLRCRLQGRRLEMEIGDEGQGPSRARMDNREQPPPESLSGRGIFLVRHLTDSLEYEEGRGLVRFAKTDGKSSFQ